MLAAAVVPHPPLLVPALAAGAAADVAPLLAACDAAAAALVAEVPETVVCVGTGARGVRHRTGSWGTLAGYGVDVEPPGTQRVGLPHLPLSLTLGRWLLDRTGWAGPVVFQEVAEGSEPADCAALGRRLGAETGPRAAWLVLADGSTGHDEPWPDDVRHLVADFDADVTHALAAGDVAALERLDAAVATRVGASGRAAWQVLAGALGTGEIGRAALRYDAAPFAVRYAVASWWPR